MNDIKKILISPAMTIKQVMENLDGSAQKILMVADSEEKLLGVITDGDVRRWILQNGSLEAYASDIMNLNPICFHPEYDENKAKEVMKRKKIECIPLVDEDKKIISALWWHDFFDVKKSERMKFDAPVVIMAGGKGKRLEPFTKVLPKALIPIGNKSILEVIIEKFLDYGCENFYISVNYKSNVIKSYLNYVSKNYKISYLEEEDYLGTAGSLYMLKNEIRKDFFVHNCDIVIDCDYSEILKYHKQNSNYLTLVCSMKNYKIPYGIIEIDNNGVLKNIKEKPEYNFLVNTGMYVMSADLLTFIPDKTNCDIIEVINILQNNNMKVGVYPISENAWTDIGQMEELFLAFKKHEI